MSTQKETELRYLFGNGLIEVGVHFVGDQVLRLGALQAPTVACGVKHDLATIADLLNRPFVAAEDLLKRQPRLDAAARRGKRQRLNQTLFVELVDLLVGRAVRGMVDAELVRVSGRLWLRKGWVSNGSRCGYRIGRGVAGWVVSYETLPYVL